jgi:hypothetical protein
MDASGPTGADNSQLCAGRTGHQTAGHRTGWTLDGWTLDGWTPDGWTPDGLDTGRAGHRAAGHWTAGPPDPDDGTAEWTPHGGRGPATDAMAGILALPTTARAPDRWMAAGGSAGRPPSGRPTNQDSSAARTTGTGPATAATVSCRCYSGGQAAPRRTAVLEWIRVEGRAAGSSSSVMASAYAGGCCGVLRGAVRALDVGVEGLAACLDGQTCLSC